MRRLPDPELIALARAGSADAAGALFDRYWALAWSAAYAVTADRALADDAAHEAIERAFATLDRFDETRPFGPWLKRIAINRAIDRLRRRRQLAVLNDETATLHGWALGEAPDEDLRLWAVADVVAALGAAKRTVIVLRYWLDLPIACCGKPMKHCPSRISERLDGRVRERSPPSCAVGARAFAPHWPSPPLSS